MATTTVSEIKDGVVVGIAYVLTVEGVEMDEASTNEPLEYLHGAENIVPGLENALTGKKVGDKFSVTLQPADAYGDYDEENTDTIDRDDFPDSDTIEPGMELLLEDEDGYMIEALVKEVLDDAIVLDFNDPLAGKVVTYDVEVVTLRAADAEELDHGHPHSLMEDDDWDDEDWDDDDEE